MTAKSQQSEKHASLLTKLGGGFGAYGYEAAFHAYWNTLGTPAGTFNERMISWINTALTQSYTNIARAQNEYAVAKGVTNWDSLGDLGLP